MADVNGGFESSGQFVLINGVQQCAASRDNPATQENRHSLESLIDQYAQTIRNDQRTEHHVRTVQRQIKAIIEVAGFTSLRQIDADAVKAATSKLIERDGLRRRTVNQYLTSFKSWMKWLERKDLIVRDPLRAMRKYAVTDFLIDRRPLSWCEMMTLLVSVERLDKTYYNVPASDRAALYRAAAATGCRAGTLRSVLVRQFRFDEIPSRLRIKAAQNKSRVEKSPQIVFFATELRMYLASKMPDAKAFKAPTYPCDMVKMLRKDLADAGIAPYVLDPETKSHDEQADFHSFRVTHVSWLIGLNWNPRDVQLQAGHANIETTMKHYARSHRSANLLAGCPLLNPPKTPPMNPAA